MLFNSFEFLIFFPAVVILYFILPHKYRWFHLLVASCYFYMAFVPVYILILLGTVTLNYFSGIFLENVPEKRRKFILILTVVLNVLVLGVFKYYNFFIDHATSFIKSFGYKTFTLPYLEILLPIGLSFHTFQALSYVFEVKRGNIKAEKHFGIYSLYVMFFPQLVAGPIERPQNMLYQFHEKKYWEKSRVLIGVKIMLWGFFKKIVIADRLALYTTPVFADVESAGSINLVLAVFIFFPFQLYCDFSGYSSIALGSAKIMGFNLMENFRNPFVSFTTSEFWNRWHISLSSWLRDYLYQPIVITLRNFGKYAVVIGLFITFLISGLWHGAGYGFLLFGLVQGVVIIFEFLTGVKAGRHNKTRLGRVRGILLTYFFFAFSLIFFRALNLEDAFHIIEKLFWNFDFQFVRIASVAALTYILSFLSILFLIVVEAKGIDNLLYKRITIGSEAVLGSTLIVALIVLGIYHNLSFIYFQF